MTLLTIGCSYNDRGIDPARAPERGDADTWVSDSREGLLLFTGLGSGQGLRLWSTCPDGPWSWQA